MNAAHVLMMWMRKRLPAKYKTLLGSGRRAGIQKQRCEEAPHLRRVGAVGGRVTPSESLQDVRQGLTSHTDVDCCLGHLIQ